MDDQQVNNLDGDTNNVESEVSLKDKGLEVQTDYQIYRYSFFFRFQILTNGVQVHTVP